jgi:peptide/nickel transport system substrate-binding protein
MVGRQRLNEYPEYDLDKAKSLMAEAGYADGFDITLNCPERSLYQ